MYLYAFVYSLYGTCMYLYAFVYSLYGTCMYLYVFGTCTPVMHCVCHLNSQDRMVYKFYRDLINFRGRGEPRLMLRCINPREVRLSSSQLA